MALSSLSPVNCLNSYPTASQPFKTSATQVQASFEKAFIEITTSEGDKVTLQHSSSHAALSQNGQWQDNASQGSAFNTQTLDSHSFSYTVQGDLSVEELQDLGELFDALSLIAADFYQGNLDEAVSGALNIGDRGSLSSLAATFSQTEIAASQITSRQPYAMADFSRVTNEEQALAQHRQTQWHQILAYLDKRKLDIDQLEKKDASKVRDHDQEIMTKIQETLKNHPRLAPLINKLAEQAITDKQQDSQKTKPSLLTPELPTTKDHDFKMPFSPFARA